ncbi:MAG TPA: hypothetical protein PK794_09135, partial [Armatimonadota bacterium]|nr:hypothetical protein [Armatimonadota bacterium]
IVPAESYWDTVNTSKYPFRGTTYPTTLVKDPQTGVTGLRMGGLIRGDQDCPWDQRVVGRWFGITEPSELEPTERKIRWYEILSCTVNPDGTKDLTIQRFWWGAKEMGSPTLYRLEHGSWDGHLRPLSYAIAPGSYVTDVSKAVPTAAYAGERTLGIAPYAQAQSAVDFAPGDRIEQAIGADPFKPTAFRIWCWDQVPGAFPAPMLDLANFGADPRYAAMVVSGGPRHRDALPQTQRQMPAWEHIISVETAAGVGLNLEGDFTNAAILFQQPYHEQPLKWLYGPREPGKPVAEAVLTVSREHGDLTFTGGDVYVNGTVHARGFVGAEAAPRNSCGKDVAVQARATTITITFPQPEPDAHYVVTVEQNWLTERAITEKTATGFTVRFARPAPRGAKLDWVLRR